MIQMTDSDSRNPLELIKQFWPNADISHIEYDPDLEDGEFKIIPIIYFTAQGLDSPHGGQYE